MFHRLPIFSHPHPNKPTGENRSLTRGGSENPVEQAEDRWGTYRQIEASGGHVRKGEKGTRVLFWTQQKARPIYPAVHGF